MVPVPVTNAHELAKKASQVAVPNASQHRQWARVRRDLQRIVHPVQPQQVATPDTQPRAPTPEATEEAKEGNWIEGSVLRPLLRAARRAEGPPGEFGDQMARAGEHIGEHVGKVGDNSGTKILRRPPSPAPRAAREPSAR